MTDCKYDPTSAPPPGGNALDRRRFLGGAGALGLAAGTLAPLAARAESAAPAPAKIPEDVPVIDVHCHVFNTADLPVRGFVEEVHVQTDENESRRQLKKTFDTLTGEISRDAPSERPEMSLLQSLPHGERRQRFGAAWSLPGETDPVRLVDRMLGQLKSRLPGGYQLMLDLVRALAWAWPDREDIRVRMAAPQRNTEAGRMLADGSFVGCFWRWCAQLTRFRYRMVHDLFALHELPGVEGWRGLDIATPALVDYDHWLAQSGVRVGLAQQIEIMKALVVRHQGQLHPLAAYNPLKQVFAKLGWIKMPKSPLELVKHAVEDCGFVGVKVYPPMGFRPIGNEAIAPKDFNDHLHRYGVPFLDGLGRRLDDALRELYDWCVANEVPIMTHCRESQEVRTDREFGMDAHPAHWRTLLSDERYRALRLNLGHFGNMFEMSRAGFPRNCAACAGSETEHKHWAWEVARIAADPNLPNVFADASYLETLLTERDPDRRGEWGGVRDDRLIGSGVFADNLAHLIDATGGRLAKRIMYGTDWNLIGQEPEHEKYYPRFRRAMRRLPEATQVDFFGRNAARFLGFYREDAGGAANRTFARLKSFYERNEMREALDRQDKFFNRREPA